MTSYVQSAINYLGLPIAITEDSTKSQALNTAIYSSDIAAIHNILTGNPARVNKPLANGDLPLNVAVRENKTEVIKTLLALGADPVLCDDQNLSAIDYALLKGDEGALAVIIHHFAAADCEMTTTLLNNPTLMGRAQKIVKEVEADIKKLNPKKSEQALFATVLQGAFDKIDFSQRLNNGDSALHLAVATKDVKILHDLLQDPRAHELINQRNVKGLTPLHYAAALGRQDMIQALVAKRADIQIGNVDGLTPMTLLAAHAAHKNPLNIRKIEAFIFITTIAAWAVQLVPLAYHSPESYVAVLIGAGVISVMGEGVRYASTFKTWKGLIGSGILSSVLAFAFSGNKALLATISTYNVYRFASHAFSGLNSCWRNTALGKGSAIMKAVVGPLTTAKFGYDAAKRDIDFYVYGQLPFSQNMIDFLMQGQVCQNRLAPNHAPGCIFKAMKIFKECSEESGSDACKDAGDAFAEFLKRGEFFDLIRRKHMFSSNQNIFTSNNESLKKYIFNCWLDLDAADCRTAEEEFMKAKGIGKFATATLDQCEEAFNVLKCSSKRFKDCKNQFRELALKYHPDKSGGDPQKYMEITKAWDKAKECLKKTTE